MKVCIGHIIIIIIISSSSISQSSYELIVYFNSTKGYCICYTWKMDMMYIYCHYLISDFLAEYYLISDYNINGWLQYTWLFFLLK